ncbi:MAG: thioredoxin [Kiritimatiellae bacterium]|nr:thioredoxin [Kiritimatiellia bacterium]
MPVESLAETEFGAAVAGGVCVVDFWAPWCGPCRMMAPLFESVAAEMEGRPVKFFRVNVDEAPQAAGRFGVQSIPTLLVLKDGVEADVSVGVTPPAKLRKMVEAALS